jgi:hypothetical protein
MLDRDTDQILPALPQINSSSFATQLTCARIIANLLTGREGAEWEMRRFVGAEVRWAWDAGILSVIAC